MGLLESGLAAARALVPPKTNDLEEQQRWRWVVFFAILGAYMAITLHTMLAFGLVSSIYPGFALASDQKNVQKRVNVIASLSLEHEIRDRTFQLCHEKDQIKRVVLNDEIAKLQKEYRDIASEWYVVPQCGLL